MTTTPKPPSPAMTPVKSSQLTKVGYDEATRTLAVEFKGGAVYHYQCAQLIQHVEKELEHGIRQ